MGGGSGNLVCACPERAFSHLRMWSGYAFILKGTSFALAAVCTLHLIGNRSNPLIVKMREPLEEFHKAAHLWLDLQKRFKTFELELIYFMG